MKYFSALLFTLFVSIGFSQSDFDFFNTADNFFSTYCADGKVNYSGAKADANLPKLIDHIATNSAPAGQEKAFLINTYNLFVISKVANNYPMGSPMDDSGFFTDKSFTLNGEKISLDHLENGILRKEHTDARLHFALVCGAIGCPPITNFAYRPEVLDTQLEKQANLSLNNPDFVYSMDDSKTVFLSEIFNWYAEDFGKNKKEVVGYINGFRTDKFDDSYKVQYYPYNWTLNDANMSTSSGGGEANNPSAPSQGTNLQTFTAGSLLGKGKMDFTSFNTLYTQHYGEWMGSRFGGNRETFVTHLFQYTLGITKNKRLNLGVDVNFRYSGRSVDSTASGLSSAFAFSNTDSSRVGVTSVGLRVKVQPFKNVADFSIQSTFLIPTIEDPEGRSADPAQGITGLYWADWNRYTWWNQIFYSKTWGDFQLFTEMDLWFRFRRNETQVGMLDVPLSAFISYFPTKKITVYGMTQHVHRFTNNIAPNDPIVNDPVGVSMNYTASGIGFKYQFLPNLNVELLYTNFWRGRNTGLGNTFNIGIKYLTK